MGMHPMEAYNYVLYAARKSGFEFNDWVREGKVIEVLPAGKDDPCFTMDVILIDGFSLEPHWQPQILMITEEREKAAVELVKKFAEALRKHSGKNVSLNLQRLKGGN
ncbi:MAG: hypothetical protein G01um10143_93 [Parcubacteria group bacterium Gr01-1014_3]|nr:MAG: hypothetical protein G01um10143_93 [Parcubacteria group bacterium Gr01-1014_3]